MQMSPPIAPKPLESPIELVVMVEVSEEPRNENENLCRICMEACDDKSPCSCSGSSGYVHISCLSRWAREKLKYSSSACEICKSPYSEPTLSILKQIESEKALAIARENVEPVPWFIQYKWHLICLTAIAVIALGLGIGESDGSLTLPLICILIHNHMVHTGLGIGLNKGGIQIQRAKEGSGGYSR